MFTKVKTSKEIDNMRTSGKMLATVLKHLEKTITAGMTTKDIDLIAIKELTALGGTPSVLGYQGFTGGICTSINQEVVHGIPSSKRHLVKGDLLSLDFCVTYNGMITDSAITIGIGEITPQSKKLIDVTKKSLEAGMSVVEGGVYTGTIGAAVQDVLLAAKLGIVRDLVGHGVGHFVHEDPNIPNYGKIDTGVQLETGMTIAIEPMSTLGGDAVGILDDGWTVVTADKSLSAHFEHTVLITESGFEILTARD